MNVESISLKDAPSQNVKTIKVVRYFIGAGMALSLWIFAWAVISILRGAQDTSPHEHVHSLLSSLCGMILCSGIWLNTAAQLSANPKRLHLISIALLVVWIVFTGIDFWLMAPTMFSS